MSLSSSWLCELGQVTIFLALVSSSEKWANDGLIFDVKLEQSSGLKASSMAISRQP
jgi:hypothetical protein